MSILKRLTRDTHPSRPPTSAMMHGPWRDAEYVCIDLETTGLRPGRDHIVSVGAVPILGGRVRTRESFYSLVRTRHAVPHTSTVIHGIRTQDLIGAPDLRAVVGELADLIAGRILILHGASIDTPFLRRAFDAGGYGFAHPIVDTARIVRPLLTHAPPAPRIIALESAAGQLGIPVHTPHHALGDAFTTAGVFICAAAQLSCGHPQTPTDLVVLSGP